MRLFDEGKKIFKKKYLEIPAGKCEVFCADDLPEAKRKKAIKAFAPGITVGSVIGLIDNSIPHNASAGALFAVSSFTSQISRINRRKSGMTKSKTYLLKRKDQRIRTLRNQ